MAKTFLYMLLTALTAPALSGNILETPLSIEGENCLYITVTEFETADDFRFFFFEDEEPETEEELTLSKFLKELYAHYVPITVTIYNKSVDAQAFFSALYKQIVRVETTSHSRRKINHSTKNAHNQIQRFLGIYPRRTIQQICYNCGLQCLTNCVYCMSGFARLYELDRKLLIQQVDSQFFWQKKILIHPGTAKTLYLFFKRND